MTFVARLVLAAVLLVGVVVILAWFGALLIPVLLYLALAAHSHVSPPTPGAATRRRVLLGVCYVGWIFALAIVGLLGARQATDFPNDGLGTGGIIGGSLLFLIAAVLPLALWPVALRVTAPSNRSARRNSASTRD